ncbi:MAG: ribbon-helix-helix protein, CopG family [Myxococcales bacterium]|nr:ribbon-helix-helix protein, CopG family [Myxococcales bacterium]
MKVKTSVTLERDVVEALDKLAGRAGKRSEVIELAVREYLEQQARLARQARERALLDRHAEALNREAGDVLAYQVEP